MREVPKYLSTLPGPIRPINTKGLSAEEEFGALVQATPKLDDPLGSAAVEEVPDNMVIAKVKLPGPVEEQLVRIPEEEFAAVAGLEGIYFDFDRFSKFILQFVIRKTTVDPSWCHNLEHLNKEVEP